MSFLHQLAVNLPVCLYVHTDKIMDWMLFIPFCALRFELTPRHSQHWMGSTSSHLLCGTNLTSLCWQIRQSSFGQQQSCTIQMLISNCSIVQWCLLLRFDWILPRVDLAKSDPHCLSVRDLLMAKIGNGNHSNLFHHGVFKYTDVLLDPSGFYGPITGWLLLCLCL